VTGEPNPSTPAELLTVSQVCRRLPGARGAEHVRPSTVTRWILAGCPARDGTRVRLAATRAGGRWLIRAADLDMFFDALSGRNPVPEQPARSGRVRQRTCDRAAKELEARGA
jgi:hypothetical protein